LRVFARAHGGSKETHAWRVKRDLGPALQDEIVHSFTAPDASGRTPLGPTMTCQGVFGKLRSIRRREGAVREMPLLEILVEPFDGALGDVPLMFGLRDHVAFIRIHYELGFHAEGF